MMNKNIRFSLLFRICSIILILFFVVSACTSVPENTPDLNATAIFENALQTVEYELREPTITQTVIVESPTPEPTYTSTPEINRTPPALPQVFTSEYLNPMDVPRSYIEDICTYLKMRWDPNNASPGTIVMPIMFHSVTDAEKAEGSAITHDTLMALARNLNDQGFTAITMQQLSDFLTKNAKIPERSVILIVDDRHYADYYESHFRPLYEEYGWTVVNGWISMEGTLQEVLDGNARLQNEGWVDHQSHGVIHNIPISIDSSEDYMRSELGGSITSIQSVYGVTPIAYIWPGGGFTPRAVEIAQEYGYQLGFTVNPRGPVMFNWIPQGNEYDPARPSYIPEGQVNNPLLTLPRYWDVDASIHIDSARIIGKEAKTYALEYRDTELEYYDIVCKPITGEIPAMAE